MTLLRLSLVLLSALLMAAHFSRADIFPLTLFSLLVPTLLFVRRPWVPRAFQVLLTLAALEWVRTLVAIAARRQAVGEPWLRMAVILGVVALVTGLSALVFNSRSIRSRYSVEMDDA